MTIPDWLQRLGARVFPGYFLAPDEPLSEADFAAIWAKHCPPVVHHNHITINFTGQVDDFPAFREVLLKTLEEQANKPPRGDAS